ncbi:MAG: hydroxymethylpyrimidine/phosphomethylpyrimidine kinase [Lentisphaerales bacterium]|nr:hydroxymethylpyrimidine/phosphomethylpyrimidine kinase [Lentisphaerales bacterium]
MEFLKQELPGNIRLETPACLSIAGSDSGGEAGIQADLQTFNDFDCHGLNAITANTAQNRHKVISLNPSSNQALQDQIAAVESFFSPKFVKTGLISSLEQLQIIASYTQEKKTVIDPVLKASSGKSFLSNELREKFLQLFLKAENTITPNFDELCWLLNEPTNTNLPDIISKAHRLLKDSKVSIFLKGGHTEDKNTDFLITNKHIIKYNSPLIHNIGSSHGTGCRISSGICAALAKGYNLIDACQLAKNYVYHTLATNNLSNQQFVMHSPGKVSGLDMKVTYQEFKNDR